ncbi:unnamed protein product [Dicrocoelium dendriticum]|nr:unnamed protein product [Dicrocoelium dendriticum]
MLGELFYNDFLLWVQRKNAHVSSLTISDIGLLRALSKRAAQAFPDLLYGEQESCICSRSSIGSNNVCLWDRSTITLSSSPAEALAKASDHEFLEERHTVCCPAEHEANAITQKRLLKPITLRSPNLPGTAAAVVTYT